MRREAFCTRDGAAILPVHLQGRRVFMVFMAVQGADRGFRLSAAASAQAVTLLIVAL